MNKSFTLTPYEAMCHIFTISLRIKLNKCFTKNEVEKAVYTLSNEYDFLHSEFKDENELVLIENYHPKLSYFERNLTEEEYFDVIRETTKVKHDYMSEYHVYADETSNETVVLAFYCHSQVDAISSLVLSHKLCLYLSDTTIEPEKHPFSSVQKQVIIPSDYLCLNYSQISSNTDFFKFPKSPHTCPEGTVVQYQSITGLIEKNEFNEIIQFCHNNHFTYQSLLWLSTYLSQCKLFNINDIANNVRFNTPATAIDRCDFEPTISKDDIVCGAASIYIQMKINCEDNVLDVLRKLSNDLHDELKSKQQMYDFFTLKDFSKLPSQTFTCCTLGKTNIQKHYEGNNSFDLMNISILPVSIQMPGICGTNLHSFTVNDIGCYLCCTYTSPLFVEDEMKKYVEDIIAMMKFCCSEDNKEKLIKEISN